jgi:hypothetical protein
LWSDFGGADWLVWANGCDRFRVVVSSEFQICHRCWSRPLVAFDYSKHLLPKTIPRQDLPQKQNETERQNLALNDFGQSNILLLDFFKS